MRHTTVTRAVLLAGAIAACLSVPARASDTAEQNPVQLRDRILQDVSRGLAKNPAAHPTTPKPAVLSSRPAPLASAVPVHAASPTATLPSAPPDTSADGVWAELLAGNQRFVGDHTLQRDPKRERADLVEAQHPLAIVLGCSDSRVPPELVFDARLGELFVVRTAGNIVDPIALGSLEYAVDHLHPHLLVVLGHSGCGAVRAAAGTDDMPSTHLQAIVDRIRPTVQRLANCFEGDELIERSVTANARQSATDVLANSAILREAVAKSQLRVVSAVYDLKSGLVTPVSLPAATAQTQAPGH